jgi:hypothetical protein
LGTKIKISFEKLTLRANKTRALRLIYNYGYTSDLKGKSRRKKTYETLDLFMTSQKPLNNASTTKNNYNLLKQ